MLGTCDDGLTEICAEAEGAIAAADARTITRVLMDIRISSFIRAVVLRSAEPACLR